MDHLPRVHLKTCLGLVLLVTVCTAVNLTKPVHIDDTAYLEIAQALLRNPLRAMSAEINWDGTARPIASVNQPHLFPAFLAAAMYFSGPSELALHAAMVPFSATAILFFYLLASRTAPQQAWLLTALFALGPAFLPAQNLMTDVPVIALWLVFFWLLFTAEEAHPAQRYVLAGVALGAAILTKYPSLALLPVLVLALLLRRRFRLIWVVLMPLGFLAGWSYLNYLDYGQVHVLQRITGKVVALSTPGVLMHAVEWVATLGAVAPFSAAFLSRRALGPLRAWIPAGSLAVGLVTFQSASPALADGSLTFLWAIFLANGLLTIGLVYGALARAVASANALGGVHCDVNTIILLAWIASAGAFVILFAPFMAVRHLLLVLPAVLLLLGRNLGRFLRPGWGLTAVALSSVLGLTLAVSDYCYADVYRRYATEIRDELGPQARIWYTGHWGWQWYAGKARMLQYDVQHTLLSEGDYLVIPLLPSPQLVSAADRTRLEVVQRIAVPSGPATWLRTMSPGEFGGLYASVLGLGGPPFSISNAPLDTFVIFRVSGG